MASHSLVSSRVPQDTQFLHAALHNWQERNQTARTFLALSPAEQSEIMRDAQVLKAQTRAWYELQAALAIAKVRIRQEVIQ
jgi:hypothetical protein